MSVKIIPVFLDSGRRPEMQEGERGCIPGEDGMERERRRRRKDNEDTCTGARLGLLIKGKGMVPRYRNLGRAIEESLWKRRETNLYCTYIAG